MRRLLLSLACLLTHCVHSAADIPATESDSSALSACWTDNADHLSPARSRFLLAGIGGLYIGSMSWLYTQWYRDYPQSRFHFFNDVSEWEGMDKFAHGWDAYSIAKPLSHCFRWAGYEQRQSAYYGTGIAFLFQSTVEVFDGFSSQWGFSGYDMAANALGAAAFLSQELIWEEQRIVLKYSFRTTPYAAYRPDLLGSNLPERILKDYNGLTYWVSVNPASFIHGADHRLPRWFSLAVGFGAEGMTGGEQNPLEVEGKPLPYFPRYRQYYLGLDFDLARIRTKSRFWSGLFKVINIVRLPAPAIELSPGRKPKWHPFSF